MNKGLIIEGPDGAGKSTLIKQLRKYRPFITVALGGPVPTLETMVKVLQTYARLTQHAEVPIVFDRNPLISEPIYSHLLDRPSMLPDLFETTAPVLAFPYPIVYCRPPRSVICDNIMKNEQLPGVVERIGTLIRSYDDLMATISHRRYDYTKNHISEILEIF